MVHQRGLPTKKTSVEDLLNFTVRFRVILQELPRVRVGFHGLDPVVEAISKLVQTGSDRMEVAGPGGGR